MRIWGDLVGFRLVLSALLEMFYQLLRGWFFVWMLWVDFAMHFVGLFRDVSWFYGCFMVMGSTRFVSSRTNEFVWYLWDLGSWLKGYYFTTATGVHLW